jgi:hypothetical protein
MRFEHCLIPLFRVRQGIMGSEGRDNGLATGFAVGYKAWLTGALATY